MPDSVTDTFTDTQSNPNRVRESLVRGKSGRVPSKRHQSACTACLVNWLLLLGQPRTVLGAVNTSTVFSHRFKRTLNQRAARYSSPVTWTITSRTTNFIHLSKSLHSTKNSLHTIDLFLTYLSYQRSLKKLSNLVWIHISLLTHSTINFSLHTASFIPLNLPYFLFMTTSSGQ